MRSRTTTGTGAGTVMRPRPAGPRTDVVQRDDVPERMTTAQEALTRFHDAHSLLGRVQRYSRPVTPDDDGVGRVRCDVDPFD